jgi:flagellar motor switch/type III secretory pathway protein FliN
MTQTDFNHLLSSIKGLSPAQARQLRQQLDQQLAQAKKPAPPAPAKVAKRARPARPKKKMTEAEFDEYLLKIGLMSQLPDTAADYDDPDDVPVKIKGEPLSETIIRERR